MGMVSPAGMNALVTGAGKRLGRAIALALADEGASVLVHYNTSAAEAEQVCAAVRALGVQAWPLQGDLSDPDQAGDLIRRAADAAGPVQVLVNSASIFGPCTLESMTFEQVVENLAVNAWAPFVLSREFARQQIAEGRIVNLLDTRVDGLDLQHVAYILSKHALLQLTRMTAREYAPRITVNAVAPGLILPPPGKDEGYLQRLGSSLPLGRHGDADDIAGAVVYLATSSFVTGQVIYVDGGRRLRE